MPLDSERQPWLRGLSEQDLAEVAIELTYAICRPSFGSLSKRELEQTTFRILYEHRPEWSTLGQIADDLAISRSKARALVLEYRARETGKVGPGERQRLLRAEIRSWPKRNVAQDAGVLKIVVDDPFIRDLLKNYAYANGILLDHTFSGEILTFDWAAYAQLMASLTDGNVSAEEVTTISAEFRQRIVAVAATNKVEDAILKDRLDALDKDVERLLGKQGEERIRLLKKLILDYGPAVVGLLAA